MRGRIMGWLVVGLASLGIARPASGQIAWEAPMLIAPGAPAGFGLFVMEPWPGDDFAGMLTYRTSPVPVGLGLRVGLGEDLGDDLAVFGGVDLSGFLARTTGDVSLEILWFTGAGVGIGDDALFSFPLKSDECRLPVGGRFRVYRSLDRGDSWTPLANGLPQVNAYATVLRSSMAVDTFDPVGVYVGTSSGTVYVSNDAGASFQTLPVVLPRITCLEVFPAGA